MRITDRFSSEHDVFVDQLGVTLRTLAKPLLAHAEAEERALFPDLAPSMGGQIDTLTVEPTRAELEARPGGVR